MIGVDPWNRCTRTSQAPLADVCAAVAPMRWLLSSGTACSKQAHLTALPQRNNSCMLRLLCSQGSTTRSQRNKDQASMRTASIISGLALLALNALGLLTAATHFHLYFLIGSLVVALALIVAILANRGKGSEPRRSNAEAAKPMPVPAANNRAEAEIVSFLATLQEKGRLIDFLMDDVTLYDDAQVGAAARVLHEGCGAVLKEHFRIQPVREESEGSSVTIPVRYPADEYRLIGRLSGTAPFSGTLIHRGWRTESVKLPRIVRINADRLPIIAPAEVELK